MSSLGPEAREILDAARGLHEPTEADRARVRAKLKARLAAEGEPPRDPARSPSSPAASSPSSSGLVTAAGIAGVAIALVVALVAVNTRDGVQKDTGREDSPNSGLVVEKKVDPTPAANLDHPEPGRPTNPATTVPEPAQASAEDPGTNALLRTSAELRASPDRGVGTERAAPRKLGDTASTQPIARAIVDGPPEPGGADRPMDDRSSAVATPHGDVEPEPGAAHLTERGPAVRTATQAQTAKVKVDSELEAELELLRLASEALRDHAPARALVRVDEHAARFPNGMLREERDATRIVALCTIGRWTEARAARERFRAEHGASPHDARIAATCQASEEPAR